MFTCPIIRKVFLGNVGYDYFRHVLTRHIDKWEKRIPDPEYSSRYFLRMKGLLSPREEQILPSHSSAAPILSLVSPPVQSTLPASTNRPPRDISTESPRRINRDTASINDHFRSRSPAPVSLPDQFERKPRSICRTKCGTIEGKEKSILPPRITASSLARNPATEHLEHSSPPRLPSPARSTPATTSIGEDLFDFPFPESSLSTNSDPESPHTGVSKSTPVATESQRDTTDIAGRSPCRC